MSKCGWVDEIKPVESGKWYNAYNARQLQHKPRLDDEEKEQVRFA
jgi:hypothetical protein